MEQEDLKELARQLACPEGELGIALGDKMNEMNTFITERSIIALEPVQDEHILEVGFGNGKLSIPVIEAIGINGYFIGVETSSVLAQQAITHFNQNAFTQVTVLSDDCHSISIENNTLDGVLAVNVLYFIDDLDAFFHRINGWLKPGGRTVIGVRSSDSLEEMPFTQFGFNIRTLVIIKQAMHDAGFINVESEYFDEGVTQFDDLELPIDTLIIKAIKIY